MSEALNSLAAFNERGCYAICDAEVKGLAARFVREEMKAGAIRVERVTRDDAVRLHLEYLRTLPRFAEAFAKRDAAPPPRDLPAEQESGR